MFFSKSFSFMKILSAMSLCSSILLAACQPAITHTTQKDDDKVADWKTFLKEELPLLGHRNWIVVTDMAYPLQTNPGIKTIFATEPYEEVVETVNSMIEEAPHVFAHIYQDQEQQALSEELVPGWDEYKARMSQALDLSNVRWMPHEELIARLDEVSRLCQVVIIKTSLTIPYTSTFFELDCGYWDGERERKIRE